MIHDRTNIQIADLCPIQFTEPLEYQMYDRQTDYCGKICGEVKVQILISETLYNYIKTGGGKLHIKALDENNNVIILKDFTVYELSTGFYYAVATFSAADFSAFSNKVCYFEIESDSLGEIYAESLWYIINPDYTSDIYEIEYTHSENDWNTIFAGNTNTYKFKIYVEGGFLPNDPRQEDDVEDFVEQDMVNETVYADEYEVIPFTLGDNGGIPTWLAKKFSRITKCDTVKYKRMPSGEQIEHKRIKGAKLEKVGDVDEKAGMATYKIDLQTTKNYLQ